MRGFLARRLSSGRVQYSLRYQVEGTRHTLPLGTDGEITPEKARAAAEVTRGQISGGLDPARERARDRVLADLELRALWKASIHASPPAFGAMVRLLL